MQAGAPSRECRVLLLQAGAPSLGAETLATPDTHRQTDRQKQRVLAGTRQRQRQRQGARVLGGEEDRQRHRQKQRVLGGECT